MSENTHYDKEKAKTPGYDEAREVMFAAQKRLKDLGWACHMAYDEHFFLEPAVKRERT